MGDKHNRSALLVGSREKDSQPPHLFDVSGKMLQQNIFRSSRIAPGHGLRSLGREHQRPGVHRHRSPSPCNVQCHDVSIELCNGHALSHMAYNKLAISKAHEAGQLRLDCELSSTRINTSGWRGESQTHSCFLWRTTTENQLQPMLSTTDWLRPLPLWAISHLPTCWTGQ